MVWGFRPHLLPLFVDQSQPQLEHAGLQTHLPHKPEALEKVGTLAELYQRKVECELETRWLLFYVLDLAHLEYVLNALQSAIALKTVGV
jgi:hypothetical protein